MVQHMDLLHNEYTVFHKCPKEVYEVNVSLTRPPPDNKQQTTGAGPLLFMWVSDWCRHTLHLTAVTYSCGLLCPLYVRPKVKDNSSREEKC